MRDDGRPVMAADVNAMIEAILHRGPDGRGIWAEGATGIGHSRLSIVDLSARANQPMKSACGEAVLSYNGELYNFQELRRELVRLGHKFTSESDTEVVLNALIEWGPGALKRFNGMFALAFWQKRDRTLLLARDRYGIKPLYYSQQPHYFAFSSEQKGILAIPGFGRTLDREALLEYFTFQNIFTDRTFMNGVKVLPAGCYLSLIHI